MTEAARAAAADPAGLHIDSSVPLDVNGVPHGQPVLDRLIGLLDLEPIEEDIFRGVSPAESPVRVFGGQVALGEVIVLGVLGLPLMRLLPRNPKFREIIRSYQKE